MKKLYNIAFFCLFALFLISCGGGDGEEPGGGGTADTTPPAAPVISAVTSPTNVTPQTITGTKATDAASVWVSVEGGAKAAATITSTTAWSYDVDLVEGTNDISVTAKDAAGNESTAALASIVYDITAPSVDSTIPVDGASAVSVTTDTIVVNFNEAMDETVDPNAIFSIDGGVTGTAEWTDADTITFTVTSGDLPGNITYHCSAGIAAKDLAGNDLAAVHNWSFTTETDTTAPTVKSTVPADNATNVLVTATISVTFSEAMNHASAEGAFSTVPDTSGGTFAWTGNTMTYTPPADLTGGPTPYTCTISTGAQDVIGNNMLSDKTWSFTTEDKTPPAVPTIDAVTTPTNVSPQTITGTKATDAATIWVNGVTVGVTYPTTTTWSYALTLAEGANAISVTAKDAAGNESAAATTSIAYDTTPPAVPTINAVTTPTNTSPQTITGTKATEATVWINGTEADSYPSATTWSYALTLAEGANPISVTAKDALGNESAAATSSIEYDTTPPAVPGIDPVTTPTNVSPQTITGTKVEDADTIWVNGVTAGVSYPDKTTWSYSMALAEGVNPISVTAKDALGNTSAAATSSIELDTDPPTVTSTVPADAATEVLVTTDTIVLNFSEAMDETVDPNTIFSIDGGVTGTPVWTDADTITFTVTSGDLAGSTPYNCGAGTNAKDLAGNALASLYTWSFTTEADITPPTVESTVPADNATGVLVTATISVTFSEAMNEGSAQGAFYTDPATTGAFSWTGNTMTYTPGSDLESTTYTCTISTAAQDLEGNAMAALHSWDFTVSDNIPPTTTAAPAGGTFNSAQNVTLTATDNIDPAPFIYYTTDGREPTILDNDGSGVTPLMGINISAEGVTTLRFFAVDNSSNEETPDKQEVYTIDTTDPETTITTTPPDPSNDPTPSFAFESNEAGTFEYQIDGVGAWFPCTSPYECPVLGDGDHTFRVRAIDLAGNTDKSAAEYTWNIDTMAPSVTNWSPAYDGVATGANVAVTFSEAMNHQSVEDGFTLATEPPGSVVVPGQFYWRSGSETMVFVPDDYLEESTSGPYNYYYINIAGATDLAGNTLTFDESRFGVKDCTPPAVGTLTPAEYEIITLGGGGTTIQVIFTEAMQNQAQIRIEDSLTDHDIVNQGLGATSKGTLVWTNTTTLTFTSAAGLLEPGHAYEVQLWNLNGTDGNWIGNNVEWVFFTEPVGDTNPPAVISTRPYNGQTVGRPRPLIRIIFSEIIDPASIDSGDILVNSDSLFDWDYDAEDKMILVWPDAALSGTVTVEVGDGTISDLAGTTNSGAHSFSFTIGAADATAPTVLGAFPADGSVDLCPWQIGGGVRFSESVNQDALPADAIILYEVDSGAPVKGVSARPCEFSMKGRSASLGFAHDSRFPGLEFGLEYELKVSSGIEDDSLNNLVSPYTWGFSTPLTDAHDQAPVIYPETLLDNTYISVWANGNVEFEFDVSAWDNEDVPGTLAVTVTVNGGTSVALTSEGGGDWYEYTSPSMDSEGIPGWVGDVSLTVTPGAMNTFTFRVTDSALHTVEFSKALYIPAVGELPLPVYPGSNEVLLTGLPTFDWDASSLTGHAANQFFHLASIGGEEEEDVYMGSLSVNDQSLTLPVEYALEPGAYVWAPVANFPQQGFADEVEGIGIETMAHGIFWVSNPALGSISGTISPDAAVSDRDYVLVYLFDNVAMTGDPVARTLGKHEVADTWTYTIQNLPDGTYYIGAFMDIDWDGDYTDGVDPGGVYADGDEIPDPIAISGGSDFTANFTLYPPMP